jgi:signal transduction histidine kinase
LAVILSAVAVYSGYTLVQLRSLRGLQAGIIARNRMDSLLLLRLQNDLNSLGLAMRDMLDASEPYPLTAWQGQFRRIRTDLEDGLRREEEVSPATPDQRRRLTSSMDQFWDAADRIFALAQSGQEDEARTLIRLSLQARQSTLTAAVARLLVQNNDREQRAGAQTEAIYAHVERNAYIFLAAMLALVAATSLYLVQYNRRMFAQTSALAERRSELAQQLMSMQEDTYRYISRELHDEFGQILTAIGAMLQGTARRAAALDAPVRADLQELREIVQSTLDRIRALSQSLHPAVIDDAGFEGALNSYLPGFEKQTGVEIRYEKQGESRPVDGDTAIHLYRVLQEALNNVVRHSKSARAAVRLRYLTESVVLEVEDEGVGFGAPGDSLGLGVTSMRERAELVHGRIELLRGETGGALVRLTVPLAPKEAHAGA